MALKNVKRVTFSLPKTILKKMELTVPSSKRSKFVAEAIEKYLKTDLDLTFEEVKNYWQNLAQRTPQRSDKTILELISEDRNSH